MGENNGRERMARLVILDTWKSHIEMASMQRKSFLSEKMFEI